MQLKYGDVYDPAQSSRVNCTDVFYDGKQARLAGHITEAQAMQTIAGRNQRAAQVKQVTS